MTENHKMSTTEFQHIK